MQAHYAQQRARSTRAPDITWNVAISRWHCWSRSGDWECRIGIAHTRVLSYLTFDAIAHSRQSLFRRPDSQAFHIYLKWNGTAVTSRIGNFVASLLRATALPAPSLLLLWLSTSTTMSHWNSCFLYKKGWILRELLDGHEFLIILPTDIFWSQVIDNDLVDGEDAWSTYTVHVGQMDSFLLPNPSFSYLYLREWTENLGSAWLPSSVQRRPSSNHSLTWKVRGVLYRQREIAVASVSQACYERANLYASHTSRTLGTRLP